MRPSPVWLLFLALIAFGLGVLGTFILDDYAVFSDPAITSRSGWFDVWRLEQTRPLTYFTFWLNYHTSGKSPAGYHVVNLAIHLGTVWIVYAALKRTVPESTAWLATAIFATHPLQSEAVNYIFARSTLLMALFCALSLNAWLKKKYWHAVLWFALAVLAKEEAVAWPVFLALLSVWQSRLRTDAKAIGAMLGIALVAGIRVTIVASATPGSGAGKQAGVTAWDYFWTQGAVIWRYLGMTLIPVWPYRMDSPIPQGFYWYAWIALIACCVAAAMRFKSGGVWFLGAIALLLPSSSIFPAADLSADRRMYLPLLALSVLLASIVPHLRYGLIVLAAISAYRTWSWLDAERFWRAQAAGGSLRSQVQLARVVNPAEAQSILEAAKQTNPDNSLIASELGRVYLTSGSHDKALAEFGRALALAPGSAQAFSNRGVALILLKQADAAKADFARALQIDPCSFEVRLNAKQIGLALPPDSNCRFSEDERAALSRK